MDLGLAVPGEDRGAALPDERLLVGWRQRAGGPGQDLAAGGPGGADAAGVAGRLAYLAR